MTNAEVISELHQAVAQERISTRRVLMALQVFDDRDLAADHGYASTFEYCLKVLGYDGNAAYKRINVARLAKVRPEVIDKVESGKISLSAASAIFPYARKPDGGGLIKAVEGKTAREVEAMVAKLSPEAVMPRDTVTPLALLGEGGSSELQLAYRVSITLSDQGYEKLKRATDLLRHKHPRGEPRVIVEDALEALLDAVDRGRKEEPAKPRGAPAVRTRRIPEWVKDLVWKRDGGRCAFIARDGRRCEAAAFLQYDHAEPYALGGASDDPRNVRLLCAAHNQLAARAAGVAIDREPRGE